MRDLDECSGPWVGWWIQWGRRGHMRMTLRFADGRIRGGGIDDLGGTGPFEVMGEYAGEIARLGKAYGTHVVRYDGRWNGASVAGPWTIAYGATVDRGEFEMWPERESLTVEEILARADEALERRDLVPSAGVANSNSMVA